MYAVIETGGKQYRVAPGDIIEVERGLEATADDGGVEFSRVLLVGGDEQARVGAPLVDGARVKATALAETRGPKVRVFKMKRRKGYRRTRGHRQDLVRVRIDEIVA
ncbi:MAG: 50S ribosomal protein L21 [Thermoanaerobaculia bacterium]